MRRLAALLLLPWIVTGALAEELSLPRLVSDAQRLNEARALRIDAEMALQQTIVTGRQNLLDEGYAAPLEVDLARTRLRETEALRSSVHKYRTFLAQLIAACRSQPQPLGGKHQVMIRWPGTPAPTVLLFDVASVGESYEELKSLSEQIAAARERAQGRLKAIVAEVTFLQELIKRLRGIRDGSAPLDREIELASMRLKVAESRLAMGKAQQQYESAHDLLHQDSNRRGFPIPIGDQSVDSPAQLWQLLELQWQIHRTEAEREAVVARRDMQSMYHDKLAALADTGFGRPGESGLLKAAKTNALQQLSGFDHKLTKLHRFRTEVLQISATRAADDQPSPRTADGYHEFSDNANAPSGYQNVEHVRAAITAARWRIAQITRISPHDEATANELTRANLELAVHEAELQIVKEVQTISALAGQLRRYEPQATTINVSTTRGLAAAVVDDANDDEHAEILVAFFATKAKEQGKLALAKSRTSLSKSKRAHVQRLRRLGYATWKEVAKAERDLAISQADELAAEEERRIARLEYQRVKLAIDTKQSFEPHIAALPR